MEEEKTQATNYEKFSKGYDTISKFITPIAILILFIFNFGYGWRDTQASTRLDIDELKAGQKAVRDQMTTGRNERLTQIEETKREVKNDIRELRESQDKQNALEREDFKRLEEKVDRLIEKQLK